MHHATASILDSYEWIVDSASNLHITPFKHCLQNYREFNNPSSVKGLSGNPVLARGTGSITLLDDYGHRHTIDDSLYVESTVPILSLVKLVHSSFRFHFLDDNDDGDFLLTAEPPGLQLLGHTVNNILYIHESRFTPQTLMARTRGSFKRNP